MIKALSAVVTSSSAVATKDFDSAKSANVLFPTSSNFSCCSNCFLATLNCCLAASKKSLLYRICI
ncbi:hypothetical protein D3C87_1796360 [compost metagenome]